MGMVDTAMVGRVSPVDIAAVAVGNLYFFQIAVFGMGVLLCLEPILSQAIGASDDDAVALGIQRGLVLSVGLGILVSLFFLPAAPILSLLGQPPSVVPIAADYALAAIPGMIPFFAFYVLRVTMQAFGRVAPIVWTIVGANLLNVFLNWVLIFGNLGFPAMGAVGSSWGSSVARWCVALTVFVVSWKHVGPYLRRFRREILDLGALKRMLGLGVPIGFQQQLEFGAFAAIGLLMGILGVSEQAGHQVALQLAASAFMIPVGIAAAASVLVGRAIGRGDMPGARRAAGAGMLGGGAFMVLTAAVFLTIPGVLSRLFTADQEVLAVAIALIPIAGLFQVADGLQAVAAGVLRGAGDTRWPSICSAAGFWLLGMPISLVMAFVFGMGAQGLWWGLAGGLSGVAVLLIGRMWLVLGRHIARVEIDEATPQF